MAVTMAHTMKHWNMTVQMKSVRYRVFLATSFWHVMYLPGWILLSTTIYGSSVMEARVVVLYKPLWEKANKVTYEFALFAMHCCSSLERCTEHIHLRCFCWIYSLGRESNTCCVES